MSSSDSSCYTVVFESSAEYPSAAELRSGLEKGSDEVKIDTLRKIIISTINGNPQVSWISDPTLEPCITEDKQPTLMMPIIQFVLPSRNKQLKKLLHFYWEVCPKYDENGKLKQEMILVVCASHGTLPNLPANHFKISSAMRSEMTWCAHHFYVYYRSSTIPSPQQHPNEYIRGATLRFLQKIAKDAELLEPLIPTCRSCLEHRHSYVRKNAVFAIYSIYREFEHLIPDAPELMYTFLIAETDSTCKRNAFVFLAHCSMPKAVEYILSIYDTIPALEESLQMSIIEVIRLDCKSDSAHRVGNVSSPRVGSHLIHPAVTLYPVHIRTSEHIFTCGEI